jgi:invasion protein IalB
MTYRFPSAPTRLVRRVSALIATTAAVALIAGSAAAQTQAPQPTPQRPAPAPKVQPKKTPPAPAQPQAQPQPAPQQQQAGAPSPEQQQLPIVYSPWTKFCGKDQNQAGAKEVCLTVKEARLETGQFVAGAALIEQEGEAKKIMRITLPLGMQLVHGTRIILDKDQPMMGRYVVCLPNGCMADFEVNQDFVGKLKKGQQIVLQGINLPGQAASYPLPLSDFAKANEGPATDPKAFEEQQRKLQEELQRRAEEARKKLQDQPGATPPAQR